MIDSSIKMLASIMDFIRIDIFTVFGLYSIIYVICAIVLKDKHKVNKFDAISCRLINFSGLVYFGCFLFSIILILCKGDEAKEALTNRMFGPYWFAYFSQPITYLLITQLLRLQKVRNSKIARLLFVPFMLITFEVYVILMTSLHRDNLANNWSMDISIFEVIIGFSTKILFYIIIVGLFYLVTERLRNRLYPLTKEIN